MSLTTPRGASFDSGVDGSKASAFVLVLMAICAFGPYVHPALGFRTEQLAVYTTVVFILVFRLSELRVSAIAPILALWSGFVVLALIGAIGVQPAAQYPAGNTLAGIDNLVLPVAVMLVVCAAVAPRDAEQLLTLTGKVIVIGAVANALIALASIQTNLSDVLRHFWAQASVVETTAEFAAELGRYGGIFNQPAEAGIAYGLAALLAVYVYSDRPWLLATVLTLISLGGILCVSKIFILAGVPLALYFLVRRSVISGRAGTVLAIPVAIVFGPRAFGLGDWLGLDFLARLVNPNETTDLVDLYTAGRYSSGSRLQDVIEEVLAVNPILGVGAGGWAVPYDSAWGDPS